jgi:glycosyltransferase involved in cell wall biosynthesis
LDSQQFIEESIQSVFHQTYEFWELLLVDDGSVDASTEIALRYTKKYPHKVRYLQHKDHQNLGRSASRNLGISHAKGEYIAFLDADDVYLPHKLEHQVAILEFQPTVSMTYGGTEHWYSWNSTLEDNQDSLDPIAKIDSTMLFEPPELLKLLLLRKSPSLPGICSVLIRRELVTKIGGFELSFSGMYDDQVFYSKIYSSEQILVSPECYSKYRQHQNSCCKTLKEEEAYNTWRTFLNWLEAYLLAHQYQDSEIFKVLSRQQKLHSSISYSVLNQQSVLRQLSRHVLPKSWRQWAWKNIFTSIGW